jgi:Uma2 family endonuclease
MAIKQRRMTLEEFLELPEEKPSLEFEDGVVTQKVPPQAKHGVLQSSLCEMINLVTRRRKIALAIPELRTTYARYSRVPDVAVYTWERIPRDPDGRIADDFRHPPDIAIEIISPRQRVSSLIEKCTWYIDHGVKVALIVDPNDDSVRRFRPGEDPVTLQRADLLDLSDAVPGLSFSVGEIFDRLLLED